MKELRLHHKASRWNFLPGSFLLASLWLGTTSYAQTPNFLWANRAGGTSFDQGIAIAVDNLNNVAVTGSFRGIATFGTSTLITSSDDAVFVAKYDPAGNSLWARQADGSVASGMGIATDGFSNIIVTGIFRRTISFGAVTLTAAGGQGDADIFVAKYDPAGNLLWAKQAGGVVDDGGRDVATDAAGNIYVIGTYRDSATFGTFALVDGGNGQLFIAKLDPNGEVVWVQPTGRGLWGGGFKSGIAVDHDGDIVVTGEVDYSSVASPLSDIFVAKYDPSGNAMWTREAGGPNYDNSFGITTDDSNNIIITGYFQGSATFGSIALNANGGPTDYDVFVAKYDPSGNVLWARNAGSTNLGSATDIGFAVAADGLNNIMVTGNFRGTATFGTKTVTSAALSDVFIAQYDPSGNVVWVKQIGQAGSTSEGFGIATDAQGRSTATGYFQGTAGFDGVTLTSLNGSSDIFLAKLGPEGSGDISGTVTDAITNHPIQGASVTASGGDTDPDGTDASGYYQIPDVPAGSGYNITASAQGYEAKQESNITVVAGQTTAVNFALTPLGTKPVVEVSGTLSTNSVWSAGNLYKVIGDVTVPSGVILTVQPGTVIKFGQQPTRLDVHGVLSVVGTSSQPIIFTSLKDDSYEGDTNNDGTASSPAPGDWSAIWFYDNSDDASVLDHCVIKYGGYYQVGFASIHLQGASPTISSNEISYGYQGIYCDQGSAPSITGNLISHNSQNGIYSVSGSNPIIFNNSIVGNSGYGVVNATSEITVNAEYNYWGDPSGPHHPITNPNGLGDAVSDYVDYVPWLTGTNAGTISGIVSDANTGQPIQGSAVAVSGGYSDPDGSDANGFYEILNVPAGSGYTVTASATGYQAAEVTSVSVAALQTTTVNFALTSGPRPDLTPIRASGPAHWRADLSFAPSSRGSDWVSIVATVQNHGKAPASNIKVELYDGNPSSGGRVINANSSGNRDNITQIPANSSGTISVDWQPGTTGGKNGIFAVVDPQNLIAESNENNNQAAYYKPPVLLIPGIAGSPFYENAPVLTNRVWVNAPPEMPWEGLLKLYDVACEVNDGLSRLILNNMGEPVRIILPGPAQDISIYEEVRRKPLDETFKELIDQLTGSGGFMLDNLDDNHEQSENLFFFLYDWRIASVNPATALRDRIEAIKGWTDSDQVTIIAHSMGGMVTKYAINEYSDLRASIDRLIFCGTPHLGAPKFFYVLETGNFNPGLFPARVKNLIENSPGGYQLLPSLYYFTSEAGLSALYGSYIQPLFSIQSLFSSGLNYEASHERISDKHNPSILGLADSFVEKINDVDFGNIEVINIVGYDLPTIGRVFQRFSSSLSNPLHLSWEPIYNLNGDGTVPLRSAEKVKIGSGKANYYIKDAEHAKLPSDSATRQVITDLLDWVTRGNYSGNPRIKLSSDSEISDDLFERFKNNKLQLNYFKDKSIDVPCLPLSSSNLAVQSQTAIPNLIEIIDTQGRRSVLTADYQVITDIPGSTIELNGSPNSLQAIINLPLDDTYEATMYASTEADSIELQILQNTEGLTDANLSYGKIAVTPNASLHVALHPIDQPLLLLLDQDGDGQYETQIRPEPTSATKLLDLANPGWHLFAPPVDLSGTDISYIFGLRMTGEVFAWDGTHYLSVDTVKSGIGYWLLVSEPRQTIVSGIRFDSLSAHYLPGWHLIGPLSKAVEFSNPNDTPDGAIIATFGWDPIPESYYPATTLEPGKGYWIAVAQECDLTIGGSSAASVAKATNALSWQQFEAKFGSMPPPPPNMKPETKTEGEVPTQFSLSQNYPNPFIPETVIEYQLPEAGYVSLKIYNALGQAVRTLVEGTKTPGYYRVTWDGKDESGERVKSGLYFYRLEIDNPSAGSGQGFVQTRKGVLLK